MHSSKSANYNISVERKDYEENESACRTSLCEFYTLEYNRLDDKFYCLISGQTRKHKPFAKKPCFKIEFDVVKERLESLKSHMYKPDSV